MALPSHLSFFVQLVPILRFQLLVPYMEPFVNNYFGLLRFLQGSIRDEWPAALFSILQGSRQVMYFEIGILRIDIFHHERKVAIHLLLIELAHRRFIDHSS